MTASNEWLKVESLDLEGQGVAHNAEGKVVFIEGALAGEEVQVQVHRRKNNWEQATMTALRDAGVHLAQGYAFGRPDVHWRSGAWPAAHARSA